MNTAGPTRLLATVTLIFALIAGPAAAADSKKAIGPAVAHVKISFMLDPSITRGMYMGERWVSPPTYSGKKEGKEFAVDARAHRVRRWEEMKISPEWIPSDHQMVQVEPRKGHQVRITVKKAGQSSLKVVFQGVSTILAVKAKYEDKSLQVDISQ